MDVAREVEALAHLEPTDQHQSSLSHASTSIPPVTAEELSIESSQTTPPAVRAGVMASHAVSSYLAEVANEPSLALYYVKRHAQSSASSFHAHTHAAAAVQREVDLELLSAREDAAVVQRMNGEVLDSYDAIGARLDDAIRRLREHRTRRAR